MVIHHRQTRYQRVEEAEVEKITSLSSYSAIFTIKLMRRGGAQVGGDSFGEMIVVGHRQRRSILTCITEDEEKENNFTMSFAEL